MRFIRSLTSSIYVFHKDSGRLVFDSGESFETQILGVETAAQKWRWARSDDSSLPPELTVAAEAVRAYGESHALPELVQRDVDASALRCAGHTLAAIATVVHEDHPYFRCDHGDGVALFVLLPVSLPDDSPSLDRATARQAISDMFAAYAQTDDMLTLRSAMEACGFAVESTATEIIGRRAGDEPMVFQRAWFR
jgi:hypothetical protein